ncbi:hypothetical protein AeRB84_018748 [Aphanomyces euteiches]|nr:hypothetical protein AeRB84_018748 [Aphanomyces euteiches]
MRIVVPLIAWLAALNAQRRHLQFDPIATADPSTWTPVEYEACSSAGTDENGVNTLCCQVHNGKTLTNPHCFGGDCFASNIDMTFNVQTMCCSDGACYDTREGQAITPEPTAPPTTIQITTETPPTTIKLTTNPPRTTIDPTTNPPPPETTVKPTITVRPTSIEPSTTIPTTKPTPPPTISSPPPQTKAPSTSKPSSLPTTLAPPPTTSPPATSPPTTKPSTKSPSTSIIPLTYLPPRPTPPPLRTPPTTNPTQTPLTPNPTLVSTTAPLSPAPTLPPSTSTSVETTDSPSPSSTDSEPPVASVPLESPLTPTSSPISTPTEAPQSTDSPKSTASPSPATSESPALSPLPSYSIAPPTSASPVATTSNPPLTSFQSPPVTAISPTEIATPSPQTPSPSQAESTSDALSTSTSPTTSEPTASPASPMTTDALRSTTLPTEASNASIVALATELFDDNMTEMHLRHDNLNSSNVTILPPSMFSSHFQRLVSHSSSFVVTTAVTTSVLTVLASATSTITTVSTAISTIGAGTASVASATSLAMPSADVFTIGIMFDYLQFIASSGHLEMPGAPPFYHDFTDSLAWTQFVQRQPSRSSPSPPSISIANGDIVAGVLAYAKRLQIEPEKLFATTVVGLSCVIGIVVALASLLYGLVTIFAAKKFNKVKQSLRDELPRSNLFACCVLQAVVGVALLSEYALSMTSCFQMRYANSQSVAFASLSLVTVCFGVLLLGLFVLYGKDEAQVNDPAIKFPFGAYYKYYTFDQRYFFVPKMAAEICSGVIVGRVSDVPTQLSLLLILQFSMFLYTTHCRPYLLEFQTICASAAYVMKIITYALLSSFITTTVDPEVQEFAGMVALVLQIVLVVLFNSRQVYILFKQVKCLIVRRRRRQQLKKARAAEAALLSAQVERHSIVSEARIERAALA